MKFTRRDSATLFVSSLVVGIFTDTLVRQRILGLNFLILTTLWFTILTVVAILKRRLNLRFLASGIFALINALLVYVRAEPEVQFWSIIIVLVCLINMCGMLYAENFLQLNILNRIKEFFTGVKDSLVADTKTIYRALTGKRESTKPFHVSSGVIIAVILGLIFIGLFSGSDAVFRHQFSFIGSFFNAISDWLKHYNLGRVVTIIFWICVSGAALLIMADRDKPVEPRPTLFKKYLSHNDGLIILGTLCAVFGLFILIQIRYLFAGGSLPNGLTYANYARRGYGELLLATMLASAVVYATGAFAKDLLQTKARLILANALVILNGIVVLSAWKRLSLYEGAYGWTMTRFIARLGLICIMLGSVLLLAWVTNRLSAKRLFGYAWYIVGIVLTVAAILNPIGIITQKNITERPGRDVPLDAHFILGLSNDSNPALCKYAPALKSKYPTEYQSLQASQIEYRPRYLNPRETNSGLSAHYTLSNHYKQTYNSCLK